MEKLKPNNLLVYMNILKPELMVLGVRDRYEYKNNNRTKKIIGKVVDCLLLSVVDDKGKKNLNCPISINVNDDFDFSEKDVRKLCSFQRLLGRWYWDFNSKCYKLSLRGEGLKIEGRNN